MMLQESPLVLIFTKFISEGVVAAFRKDLNIYLITNVKEVHTPKELFATLQNSQVLVYCVCSAAACYNSLAKTLEQARFPKLKSILLFCGPREDFYAKWASSFSLVTFLSHNMKEVRRAILWQLSGGTFNSAGEAVAPVTTKRRTAPDRLEGQFSCPIDHDISCQQSNEIDSKTDEDKLECSQNPRSISHHQQNVSPQLFDGLTQSHETNGLNPSDQKYFEKMIMSWYMASLNLMDLNVHVEA